MKKIRFNPITKYCWIGPNFCIQKDLSFSNFTIGIWFQHLVRFKFHKCFWSAIYEFLWSSSKVYWGSWLDFRIKGHANMCQFKDQSTVATCWHEKYNIKSDYVLLCATKTYVWKSIFLKKAIFCQLWSINALSQWSSSSFQDDFYWGLTKDIQMSDNPHQECLARKS